MRLIATSLCFAAASIASISLRTTPVSAQRMKCEIGPVTKTYGSAQWLVYSCDDAKSIVLVSAPGNPATPFYFMFYPVGSNYQLEGEGTGDKNSTAAAFGDLKQLSADDITALIKETKMVRDVPPR
jgi:hypothetical protein